MPTASARLLVSTLSLCVLLACQSDEQKLAEHMSRGDAYLEEEKYAEAIIEYKSAQQLDPNLADAHWGLAQAYLKNNQAREGFWELRETARLDPTNLEAKLQFGQLSIYAGDLDEALTQASEVIAADPDRVRAYLLKGQALEAQKQTRAARIAYEKAVSFGTDADDAESALALLADFHNRRGDREQAEPLFRKLAEVDPSFRTYLGLASFLVQGRDRDDEAEEAYRKALELAEPDQKARAYGTLGGFYFTRDRFDEAVSTLETGIDELDDPLDLIYLLARFYNMRGENEKADDLVEGATRARPDDLRPFLVLSTYRARRNDLTGALEAAQQAVALDPDNHEANLRVAEVLVDLGFRDGDAARIAEGRGIVESLLAQWPDDPGSLVVKAKIDLAQAHVQDAITALHAALDGRPDWAQAHFLLGSALAIQGDRTAARTELARALEIDAGIAEARKVLARVHHSLGEYEYAIEEGRRFLAERPDDSGTRIVVAQSLLNLGRRTEALQELDKVPEEARDARVLFAFGQMSMGLGQFPQARQHFERAHELLPQNPDVLRSLLALDTRENRFAESVARIDAALEAAPESGKLHQLKGLVAQMTGNLEAAEGAFKRAVEADPDDLSGYERLANFYARAGRSQQAIQTYEQAVAVRPERAQLHYMLGVLYEITGQREKAIGRYEEAIRRAPDLGEAKNNLAYLFADAGENLDRALDLAQEAKALLPDNPNAADTLGWVLYKRGIPSAAISFLKEAESGYEPHDASLGVVRHHLALAYEANDQKEQARETVERALADLEAQVADAKARSRPVAPEPAWAADMRAMLDRLSPSSEG